MGKRMWRAALAAGAVVALGVVLLAVLAFVVVPRPAVQEWLGGRLSAALGPAVNFRSVALDIWPVPAIRVDSVSLGAEPVAATAGSLACTLEPASLLAGEIVVAGVTVVAPVLSVTRAADGSWRLGGLERLLPLASGGGKPAPQAPRALPRRLRVRNGSVEFVDRRVRGGPVSLVLRDLDAAVDWIAGGQRARVRIAVSGPQRARLEVTGSLDIAEPFAATTFEAEVRGQSLGSDTALLYLLFGLPIRNPGGVFDIAGSVSGRFSGDVAGAARIDVPHGVVEGWGIRLDAPVSLAADFDVKRGAFAMHGARLEAARAAFAPFGAERTTAEFDWAEDRLRVQQLALAAYGGHWLANGAVDFHDTASFSAEITAADVAFRDLASAATGEPVTGGFESLAGQASLGGDWRGADVWRDGLTGSGRIRFAGGEAPASRVLHSIITAVFGRVPGLDRIAARESPAATKLETLNASFTLVEGRARTDDLDLVADAYRLRGGGSVGLAGALDLTADVALTARGVEKVYVLAAMPFRSSGDESLPAVPVRITGHVTDPEVRPDLAGMSLAPFRRLLGGAAGAVDRLVDLARPDRKPAAAGGMDPTTGGAADAGATAGP